MKNSFLEDFKSLQKVL